MTTACAIAKSFVLEIGRDSVIGVLPPDRTLPQKQPGKLKEVMAALVPSE